MGLKARSSQLKTQPGTGDVEDFLGGIRDERRRAESRTLLDMMREVTGEDPIVWGKAMVGFGRYHYRYASGRQGDWFRIGFSPRKQALTIYCIPGHEQHRDLLADLGRHTTGVSCLYVPRLEDVDLGVLRQILDKSWAEMAERYPSA